MVLFSFQRSEKQLEITELLLKTQMPGTFASFPVSPSAS